MFSTALIFAQAMPAYIFGLVQRRMHSFKTLIYFTLLFKKNALHPSCYKRKPLNTP
jgi:hypothetical protein